MRTEQTLTKAITYLAERKNDRDTLTLKAAFKDLVNELKNPTFTRKKAVDISRPIEALDEEFSIHLEEIILAFRELNISERQKAIAQHNRLAEFLVELDTSATTSKTPQIALKIECTGKNTLTQEWLRSALKDMMTETKAVEVSLQISEHDDSTLAVHLKNPDSYALLYSIYSSFRFCADFQPETEALPPLPKTFYEKAHSAIQELFSEKKAASTEIGVIPSLKVLGNLTLHLNLNNLKTHYRENVQPLYTICDWLRKEGFEIQLGKKTGAQVFSEAPEFRANDDAGLQKRFGVTLDFAKALAKEDGIISLGTFSFLIQTRNDLLMETLEFYYREAGLKGMNGLPKTFIEETRQPGQLHKTNLAATQARELLPYILRMIVAKDIRKEPISALSEAGIQEAFSTKWEEDLKYTHALMRNSPGNIHVKPILPKALALPHTKPMPSYHFWDGGTSVTSLSLNTYEDFEKAIEQNVNAQLILGPGALRILLSAVDPTLTSPIESEKNLVENYKKVAILMETPEAGACAFPSPLVSYVGHGYSGNVRLGCYSEGPKPFIAWYLLGTMPEELLSDMERKKIRELPTGYSIQGRLLEIRDFMKNHSPYYVIKQITDKFSEKLYKTFAPKELEKILHFLNVIGDDLARYKIDPTDEESSYNRFLIIQELPLIVLRYCMEAGILLNPQFLSKTKFAEAVCHPRNHIQATDPTAAKTVLEWRINERFHADWRSSSQSVNRDSTSVSTYSSRTLGSYKPPSTPSSSSTKAW